jgi:hypothetical protein
VTFSTLVKLAIVAAIVILSAMNASWIAPQPPGVLRLIAAKTGDEGGCMTQAGAQKAFVDGADYLVVDSKAPAACVTLDAAAIQMPKRKFIAQAKDANTEVYSATKPQSWVWDTVAARACYDDYFKLGWLGIVPESCRGKTMLIPLDGQLKVWGWPKRFLARMNTADVRVILGGPGAGVARADQLPDVPRDFTGYLWVENIGRIGPAIRR